MTRIGFGVDDDDAPSCIGQGSVSVISDIPEARCLRCETLDAQMRAIAPYIDALDSGFLKGALMTLLGAVR